MAVAADLVDSGSGSCIKKHQPFISVSKTNAMVREWSSQSVKLNAIVFKP